MNTINSVLYARNDHYVNKMIRAYNGYVPITRNLAVNLGYNVNRVPPGATKTVSYNQALRRAKLVDNGRPPVPNRGTSPNRYTPTRRNR